MKTTTVALGPHFDEFIQASVLGGRYTNASEVIRAGLRKLEEDERKIEQWLSIIFPGKQLQTWIVFGSIPPKSGQNSRLRNTIVSYISLYKTFPAFLVFSQETIARLKRDFWVIESAIISSSSKSMTMVQSG